MTATVDFFARLVAALDAAEIPYMVTGSFASSFHGVPRASQDVDFVIEASREKLTTLVKSLPDTEYYVDLEAALDALRRESLFNVIDFASGWKADLIIRRSRAFSRQEFSRRTSVDLHGVRLFIASAEDTIVSKLEWAKRAGSQRQLEDVAGVLRVRPDVDLTYVERWARELELEEQLAQARVLAGS